jgi:methyl-accepting chemotaxis protein
MTTGQITGLAVLELLLIGAVWYACLKASHRIAGPVFVFTREIERLGRGDLSARVVLREKDNFRPEAKQINDSITALRDRIEALKDLSEQLEIARQNGGDVGPIAEKLSSELSSFTLGNK